MCTWESAPEPVLANRSWKELEAKAPSASSEAHHMHLLKAGHSRAPHYFAELGGGAIINKIEINWEQNGKQLALGRFMTYMSWVYPDYSHDLISHQTLKKGKKKKL